MEGSDRKPVCKQKPRRKKENQEIENEGDENNYFRWNVDMERALADILREERRLGNKGDGGWKTAAYEDSSIYYLLNLIFIWHATKKMISVDEDHVWQEYVKSHSGAKSFRWKVIPNWDDIVDLCGKDRTMGEGAETGVEAVEIMTPPHNETNHIDLDGDTQGLEDIEIINDISPTSANVQKTQSKRKPTNFVDVPHTKKKPTTPKDMIADSLAKMASSFQEYICADTKKLDPTEVYDEVNAIPDLSEEEQIKACAWLIENDKQFLMLKTLPVEKKKNMVLLFTSRGA
ncbi:uncharacterized protein [Pyrus communis]|uniref:uncharacterized protein n=1 Tax=Pyrus communis TaxID=23211 RepID=UPI0035C13B18